jgi:hypothetical protein
VHTVELGQIVAVWTHCYHVTYDANLVSIRHRRAILPADDLLRAARKLQLLRRRRTRDEVLRVEGQEIIVRNQRPLDPAGLDLEPDGTMADYVACLNSHAYFWPGTASGPIDEGVHMFNHAGGRPSIVIRVRSRSLIQANTTAAVYVSTCNTGATRAERGEKHRRGAHVFEPFEGFSEPAARIVEISFSGVVCLPTDTRYASGPTGPWRYLFQP